MRGPLLGAQPHLVKPRVWPAWHRTQESATSQHRTETTQPRLMEARMLNLIGATVGMMAVAINLVAMAGVLPLSPPQRLVLAGGAGAWVGLAIGFGAAGALVFSPEQKVPLIGVL